MIKCFITGNRKSCETLGKNVGKKSRLNAHATRSLTVCEPTNTAGVDFRSLETEGNYGSSAGIKSPKNFMFKT